MKLITELMMGKIPISFIVLVEVPGIYLIKTFPKGLRFTINGLSGDGAFELEKGQYKIVIENPRNMAFKFIGKLVLSQEQREIQVEYMKNKIEEES